MCECECTCAEQVMDPTDPPSSAGAARGRHAAAPGALENPKRPGALEGSQGLGAICAPARPAGLLQAATAQPEVFGEGMHFFFRINGFEVQAPMHI